MKAVLAMGLFGLSLLAPVAAAAGMSDADCASLDVHVIGAAAEGGVECEEADFGSGDDGKSTNQLLQVRAARSFLAILHVRAGVRTYINPIDIKDMVETFTVFDSTAEWGEVRSNHEFKIQEFRGVFGGASTTMPCFGFSRHVGRVSGTTGYRHSLWGFYCDFLGEKVDAARIDELLAGVVLDYD
jgi:hypothetical protein